MLTPWRPGPAAHTAHGELHIVATEFVVPGWRARLGFMRRSAAISRQAAAAQGMVGMRLEARLGRGVFRTISAWESPAAARAFATTGAHAAAMGSLPAGAGDIRSWTADADEVPLAIVSVGAPVTG